MKKLFICIISLLSFQLATAQTNVDAILVKVKENLFANNLTQFDFTISIVNFEANFHNEQEGTLTASQDKFILDLKEQAKVMFNGKTRWTIIDEDEEIQISGIDEDEEELSFSKYFENYKDEYTVKMGKSVVKDQSLIILTPKDAESDTKLIEVQVNNSDYSVASISEHGKNGTIRNIKVKTFKVLEKGSVSFEPNMDNYKTYEVVDMR
ncbi:MAG: LolA family protein [Flavobacteriales bacterium]